MTFKFYLWLLTCLLLCFHASAHAQQANCPPGTIPYSSGTDPSVCGPDGRQQQQQQRRPLAPPMHWKTTWGAIATDTSHGILGTATEQPSKEEAEKAALADCQSKGGTQCEANGAYYNQCVAMTVGDKIKDIYSAPTIKEAARLSMDSCGSVDTNCHVYYTACSTPFLVQ